MKRCSNNLITTNSATADACISAIEMMITEREPFRRVGYPRGGGFDRLIITVVKAPDLIEEGVQPAMGHTWWLGPRCIRKHDVSFSIFPSFWFDNQGYKLPNALVIVGARSYRGEIKYGLPNKFFAMMEVGAFLESLHLALCEQDISNHLVGSVRVDTINQFMRMPPDVDVVSALVC